MRFLRASASVLALALLAAPPAGAQRREMIVLASASLADVGGELRRALEGGPVPARFSFASTGTIRRQIQSGAPADVVLSADVEMLEAIRDHLIEEKPAVFASGTLVLAVAEDSKASVAAPGDIASQFRRIAIGDPTNVPAGQYAKEALEKLGLYETLAPRLVPSLDVRAALAAAVSGNAQAAVVYRSDLTPGRRAKEVYAFPADAHRPILYGAARVRGTDHPEEGAKLIAYLQGDGGRAILKKWGFGPPPGVSFAEAAPKPKPPAPAVLDSLAAPESGAPPPAEPAPAPAASP